MSVAIVDRHDTELSSSKRASSLGFICSCVAAAALFIALAIPSWSGWRTPLLVAIPLLLGVALIKISVVSTAYLLQMAP